MRRSDWALFSFVAVATLVLLLVGVPVLQETRYIASVPPAYGEENVTHFKGVDVEDIFRLSPQDTTTLTQGATITPSGALMPLTSAGDVSTGSITAGTNGDILLLLNTVNHTITISDTGTLKLSGDAALGQYDSLLLGCDGTNWIELAQADN